MIKTPKISVIVPIYNTEKYLKECLDSIVNQTLKDIEIICVDDGSTDSSLEILQQYNANDERINVFHQENKGAGIAKNKGIKIAKGEFICFLDSDDYYQYENNLDILYKKAVMHGADICGGNFLHLEDGKVFEICDNTFYGYKFKEEGFVDYRDWQFDYGYHRFIYNREFLVKNKLFYPPYLRFEDPPFLVKAMYKAGKFYALTIPTYLLRSCHKRVIWTKQKQLDLLSGIEDNIEFAQKYKLNKLYYLSFMRLNEHMPALTEFPVNANVLRKLIKIRKSCDITLCRSVDRDFVIHSYHSTCLKNILQSIFSLKNAPDKRHKVITILGIKIKIRRQNG